MRKIMQLIVLSISVLLLNGCINQDGPIYIDHIDIYVEGILVEGTIQYYDGEVWINYDQPQKLNKGLYYTVDIEKGSNVEVVFYIKSPQMDVKEIKIVTNKNFESWSYNSFTLDTVEKLEELTKTNYLFESIDTSYNVIEIPSWLTNKGIKYRTLKIDNSYVIWGIHLNII